MLGVLFVSIHVLRVEDDALGFETFGDYTISIHVLRVEDDSWAQRR